MDEKMERFRAAAAEQDRLLKLIADSDHAAPDLSKQKLYIAELRNQCWDGSQAVSNLREELEKEKADVDKFQNSRLRRLALAMGGQKKERMDKEEREYFEAQAKYDTEKTKFNQLEKTFEDAKKKRAELEDLVEKNRQWLIEVEELGNKVFSGPTLSFPKDDEAEERLKFAQLAFDEAQAKFFAEDQTVSALKHARGCAIQAMGYLRGAQKAAKQDILPVHSTHSAYPITWTDADLERFAERDVDRNLERAQKAMAEAVVLANTTYADLGISETVMPVNIPHRDLLWNVLLNSMVTDVIFYEKLKDVEMDVQELIDALDAKCKIYEPGLETLREERNKHQEALNARRQGLADLRMVLLKQVLEDEEGKK